MKSLFQTALRIVGIALLLIFLPTLTVFAQDPRLQLANLDHLAAKASTTVDVNIDERLIQITAKILTDPEDADVRKIVTGLKGIYVKSFEFENEGEYTSVDVEAIRAQLRNPSWSRLLNVTSKKDGNIEVYLLLIGEKIGGLALLSTEAKELTVVNIVGPVDLEKLAKLEGQFGVPDLGIEVPKSKTKNEK
jgi:Domain of unknown function (DUF4252)